MLKLILGTAGSGKTSHILNEIRKNADAGERGQYLIVPEQYSHEAERELCFVCGDSISLYAEVLSFSRLAVRVAQEAGTGGKVYLDKAGRLLCMTLALDMVGPKLELYSGAGRKDEIVLGLYRAIEEFKTAGVTSEELLRASGSAEGSLTRKLRDLSLCLETYNAVLAQGHADPADRLQRLAETLPESSVGGGHIFIDGFTDFTGMETLVIEALLKKGADLTVCLTCDGPDGAGEQFEHQRRTAFALKRLAEKHNTETETVIFENSAGKADTLSFFENNLFRYSSETAEDKDERVTLLRCGGIRDECEMAAARCIELVRGSGCRWRDLAVAARGFSDYAAPLEDAFRLYGVPLFTARRESIMQKPAAALISSAFEIIHGGWNTDDVLAYIKTGLTGLSLDECDLLENYTVMWNIRGSYWYRDRSWSFHPEGFGKKFDDASREKLSTIDALRRRLAKPLINLTNSGKKGAAATQHAQALSDFLAELKLPETLAAHARELEESGRAQLASETAQLWEIIVEALEQFAALLGDTPMTQAEFSRLFLKALSQYDVSAIPASPDCITGGEIDRMRRRHIKHLIILGASDDRIPAAAADTGLLSEDERDELRTMGIDLPGGSDRISREFSLIYNCVTLPSDTLTLSYSAADVEGASARPSFLIARAGTLFKKSVSHFDISEARLCAASPSFLMAAEGAGEGRRALAYDYFASDTEGAKKLRELFIRASAERGRLSGPSVETLYGRTKSLSPSQVEAFSNCRLAYFLRYGLRLNEKEQAGFTPPELGTFMHFVLEKTAREISDGVGFENADEALAHRLADKYTDIYISERLGGLDDKSPRFRYLFSRMRPSVRSVVTDMVRELRRSDFRPLDFELSFAAGGDLPAAELTQKGGLRVIGVADRVDGCERGGKLYVRVVDYKTGKKKFDLSDVFYGMGLQMLIYLFALEDSGKGRYGREIIPAGVLYVPARDPVIKADGDLSEGELAQQRTKNLKRSGLLLNDEDILLAMEHSDSPEYIPVTRRKDGSLVTDTLADPEQMAKLKSFVAESLEDVSLELSSGSVEPEPCYRSESDNACRFCPYAQICRFDEADGSRRYLSKIKPAEFWSRLEGEQHE